MSIKIFFFIGIVFVISLLIAFFQYIYKEKNKTKTLWLLFALRTLVFFSIGLLLVNPKIRTTKTQNNKPVLSVLIDNSASARYFKETDTVLDIVNQLKSNTLLYDKFSVRFFSFGKDFKKLDKLSFNQPQTDIANAIRSSNQLFNKQNGSIVLVSDGNATMGNDYEFSTSKQIIHSVVVGDTTKYEDLRITQLNVNKYSYIKNSFPVEIMLHYQGNEKVNSILSIYKSNKKVFSKKIAFSPERNIQTVTAKLTSLKEGDQVYTAKIKPITKEKHTRNNYKQFSIEVINQQTKILIVSSILHPDLAALKKAIESNQQRKVEISLINNWNKSLEDYPFVIFYQPNILFKNVLQQRKSNFLLITGRKTDWNFLNRLQLGFNKKFISQTENYSAVYNSNFLPFYQQDIDFASFPPLVDKFGNITTTKKNQKLLFQKVVGIATEVPLLSVFETSELKYGVLFGENFWRWRATSFLKQNSFSDFDAFTDNLVQFLATNKKRSRLEVISKNTYPANSPITITATYLDKNYQFDKRASLQLTLTNATTKENRVYPFSLQDPSFRVNLENLNAGVYTYKVSVVGTKLTRYGKFTIQDYNVEEQFASSDFLKMKKIAQKNEGNSYTSSQIQNLIKDLIADQRFYTVQKMIKTKHSSISWKWLLLIIIALLGLEWFIRKYSGLI